MQSSYPIATCVPRSVMHACLSGAVPGQSPDSGIFWGCNPQVQRPGHARRVPASAPSAMDPLNPHAPRPPTPSKQQLLGDGRLHYSSAPLDDVDVDVDLDLAAERHHQHLTFEPLRCGEGVCLRASVMHVTCSQDDCPSRQEQHCAAVPL